MKEVKYLYSKIKLSLNMRFERASVITNGVRYLALIL